MQKYARLITIGMLLAITLIPAWNAWAAPLRQGTVALGNAGFEEGSAGGWSHWSKEEEIVKIGKDTDPNNSWYTPMIVPNNQSKRVHGGGGSLEINNEYRRWRGGVYQTVNVSPNTKVVFKAWAASYNTAGQPMGVRVGIDPNGGGGRSAAVWSGTAYVGEGFVQVASPEVTAGSSGKVTVFLLGEALAPEPKTAIFFDDTSLEITGQSTEPTKPAGQPAPQPTSPPVVVQQPVQQAQPQADGSLVYTVQPGDTLMAIAFAHDITVDQLMQLNNLSGSLISVGQRLIVRGPTVPPTATLPPTPPAPQTQPTADPTAVPPTGRICILAYNDRDGNGAQGGAGEDLLPGVVFALSSSQGVLANYTTDGLSEPRCFPDLAPDTYVVNITPPSGYNATGPAMWNLAVAAGQLVDVPFGASRGGTLPTPTSTARPSGGGSSSGNSSGGGAGSFLAGVGRVALGILAVVVLIGLGAIGMYFVAMRR